MKRVLGLIILLLLGVGAHAQTPTTPAIAAMVCANNTVVPTPVVGQFFYVQCDSSGKLITTASSTAAGITIGTSAITSGANTRVLFDDSGVVGESSGLTYTKGTGTLAATTFSGAGTNITGTATGLTVGNVSGSGVGSLASLAVGPATAIGTNKFAVSNLQTYDNFTRANQTGLGVAQSGQTWTTSGAGAANIQILNNAYTSSNVSYAGILSAANIYRVSGIFNFTTSDGSAFALISSADATITLQHMLHLTWTSAGNFTLSWWLNGSNNNLITCTRSSPTTLALATDGTAYSVSMSISGNYVHLDLPLGQTADCYDTHVSSVAGRLSIYETTSVTLGVQNWTYAESDGLATNNFTGQITAPGGLSGPIGNVTQSQLWASGVSIGDTATTNKFIVTSNGANTAAVLINSNQGGALINVNASAAGFNSGVNFLQQGSIVSSVYTLGNANDLRLAVNGADKLVLPTSGISSFNGNINFINPVAQNTGATTIGMAWQDLNAVTLGTFTTLNGVNGGVLNITNGSSATISLFGYNGTVTATTFNGGPAGTLNLNGDTFLSRPTAATWRFGAADAAIAVAQTTRVQSIVAGTAAANGANWTLIGSLPTGTGTSGDIIVQTGVKTGSGTTQGTPTTALTIKGETQRMVANAPITFKGYTVSTLPAGNQGDNAFVSDAVACTFLAAITGGGATFCPVIYNGTAWVGA